MESTTVLRPTIEEFNVLSKNNDSEYAFELSLNNPTIFPVFINKLTIHCITTKDVMFLTPPPTFTYHLALGQTAAGRYVDSGYTSSIELYFPIKFKLLRSKSDILRIVITDKIILKDPAPTSYFETTAADLDIISNTAPLINSNLTHRTNKKKFHPRYGSSALIVSIDSDSPIVGRLNYPFLFDLATF